MSKDGMPGRYELRWGTQYHLFAARGGSKDFFVEFFAERVSLGGDGMSSGYLKTLFSPSDEQAMWRVQTQDDAEAFAQLVERWEQPIFRLCARMVGDAGRGEDLAQEIFAKVFTRRKDFKTDGKFSTWLWRVALNHCYDELRRLKRRNEEALGEGDDFVSGDAGPDARAASSEECELVRSGLLLLPEISRTVLALRFCEGLKLREIAEILELPETTVHSRIAVGLAQITRILKPQFKEQNFKRERLAIL
jgi:RNA polymerase sigma factor (sigma-70 family)